MVVKFFPFCVRLLGLHMLFWIHGCISIFMCVLSMLILPETQGKTLTELSEIYNHKHKNNKDSI